MQFRLLPSFSTLSQQWSAANVLTGRENGYQFRRAQGSRHRLRLWIGCLAGWRAVDSGYRQEFLLSQPEFTRPIITPRLFDMESRLKVWTQMQHDQEITLSFKASSNNMERRGTDSLVHAHWGYDASPTPSALNLNSGHPTPVLGCILLNFCVRVLSLVPA